MTRDEQLQALTQSNEELRDMLKEVAVLILKTVEPDLAREVEQFERGRLLQERLADQVHGPYCAKCEYHQEAGAKKGQWVYCGDPKGHAGPCSFVRSI